MQEAKPVDTPLDVNVNLPNDNGNEKEKTGDEPFRNLIGSLMYLAVGTRRDIMRAVVYLSQFLDGHQKCHWVAAKRVLQYFQGSINMSLDFRKTNQGLHGYVDADWGACTIDRKSYTGYAFILSGAAVSWKSQKQRTVALSSTETEYMAIAEGAKEAIYLQKLLEELGFDIKVEILNDNQSAQMLANNNVFHARSKHIDIRCHFIRDVLKEKKCSLKYIPTVKMIADGLTKAKHEICMEGLGLNKRV